MTAILPLVAQTAPGGGGWDTASLVAAIGVMVTVLIACVTGAWAVFTWKKESESKRASLDRQLKHREEVLRWKQAELAREMLDEIFDYTPSDEAWRMVDGGTTYKDRESAQSRNTSTSGTNASRMAVAAIHRCQPPRNE